MKTSEHESRNIKENASAAAFCLFLPNDGLCYLLFFFLPEIIIARFLHLMGFILQSDHHSKFLPKIGTLD